MNHFDDALHILNEIFVNQYLKEVQADKYFAIADEIILENNDIYFIFDSPTDTFIDLKKFIVNCKKYNYLLSSSQISAIFDGVIKCI